MARMECDTANVAKRIVALVIDSFQGTNVDLTQQVSVNIFHVGFLYYHLILIQFCRLTGVFTCCKHVQGQHVAFINLHKLICHRLMLVKNIFQD